MSVLAEITLWGIHGVHSKHDFPVNNRETAKEVIAISMADVNPLMEKYRITSIVDMYHSGLEHTLLWVVETSLPRRILHRARRCALECPQICPGAHVF